MNELLTLTVKYTKDLPAEMYFYGMDAVKRRKTVKMYNWYNISGVSQLSFEQCSLFN